MKNKSDSFLIKEYQNGYEDAFVVLINRYKSELFTFIYYKVLDEDLANDIFQDTFIKIIITLKEKRYNEEGKFIVWAKRIAHNLIIDYFRFNSKNHRVSTISHDDDEFSIFDILQEPSENIEDQLIKNQIFEDLHGMIHFLPESQQEVIKLRFFDGLSFKEIAEHTGTSINTTLGRVRYALINLRKVMDDNNIILTK
jgi:RNA polymerase sigma factor, sigma-70 family